MQDLQRHQPAVDGGDGGRQGLERKCVARAGASLDCLHVADKLLKHPGGGHAIVAHPAKVS
jgi:hypothetical protein